MFLKAFVVFSCLVLHITPTLELNLRIKDLHLMQSAISSALNSSKISCSNKKVSVINFTQQDRLCETYQTKFCQISEALNASNCTDSNVKKLQERLNRLKGKDTCPLPHNHQKEKMQSFLMHLDSYRISLIYCSTNN